MAFCSNCGAKLGDNQRFCSECGTPRSVPAPAAAPSRNTPLQNPNPAMQRPVQNSNPAMQRPVQNPNPAMQRPVQNPNPAMQRPLQNPNPAMQRPVQNPNPGMHRPAQPVNQAGGSDYTTYIPKAAPVASEKTTYIPRRPDAAPQQSYTPPQQSYTPPQQSYTPPQQSYAPPQQNYTIPEQAGNAGPDKKVPGGKKSGKGKKVLIVVLILLLLAALGAGAFFLMKGESDGGDIDAGVDAAVLGVYGAVDEDGNDIKGEWLELQAKGKGELRLNGETHNFQWVLEDEDLTISQQKGKYEWYGTLIDGEITLELDDGTFVYRHEDWTPSDDKKEEPDDDVAEPPVPVETAAPEAPAEEDATDPNNLAYWEGDYYGWWIINDVYEGDQSQENEWWDCCASVSFNRDGTAWVTIWDEDGSRKEPLGEVKMDISLVDTGVVEFTSISGGFGGCDVEYGQWTCRSDDDEYDQTFWFSSSYNDGEGLYFDYTFYMRPWGHDWNDIARNEPELLPRYYEDWYLPLIATGIESAPDSIN